MKKYMIEELTKPSSKVWLLLNILFTLFLTTIGIFLVNLYSEEPISSLGILGLWIINYILSEILSLIVIFKLGNDDVFK